MAVMVELEPENLHTNEQEQDFSLLCRGGANSDLFNYEFYTFERFLEIESK